MTRAARWAGLAPLAPLALEAERFTSTIGWSFPYRWPVPTIAGIGIVAAILTVVLDRGRTPKRRERRLIAAGVLLLLPSLVRWSIPDPIVVVVLDVGPALAAICFGLLGVVVALEGRRASLVIGRTLTAACALWLAWLLAWNFFAALPPALVVEIVHVASPADMVVPLVVLASVTVLANAEIGTSLHRTLRDLWRSAEVR